MNIFYAKLFQSIIENNKFSIFPLLFFLKHTFVFSFFVVPASIFEFFSIGGGLLFLKMLIIFDITTLLISENNENHVTSGKL